MLSHLISTKMLHHNMMTSPQLCSYQLYLLKQLKTTYMSLNKTVDKENMMHFTQWSITNLPGKNEICKRT